MADLIRLLPDAVANQIAAGEVVQRPASVVKELMENAVDAGAARVTVIARGAGRQQIKVIDDGRGMTRQDALMAFERHATSKITSADDLLNLHTLGFRGEALASIAAVAQVELATRPEDSELGTLIRIEGSRVTRQEPTACAKGSVFTVDNLFYNIPARRKFLKSDETEMKNIVTEFNRVAVAHPGTTFRLYRDDLLQADLPQGTFQQRLISLFGRSRASFAAGLIPILTDNHIVRIEGFVCYPEQASRSARQFFVANDRFIIHPRFRAAVRQAYDRMIQPDAQPAFYIRLTVPADEIDINIHPTKTEVKFQNENEIFSILTVAVREAIGKFSVANTMDFDVADRPEIPVLTSADRPEMPNVNFDPAYNPFKSRPSTGMQQPQRDWQKLFDGLEPQPRQPEMQLTESAERQESIYYRGRWLCVALKSGLAVIDVPGAVYRIEYDRLLQGSAGAATEQTLFESTLELTDEQECLYAELEPDLAEAGFRFEALGPHSVSMTGFPTVLGDADTAMALVLAILDDTRQGLIDVRGRLKESIADRIARRAARTPRPTMTEEERERLVARLFASNNPNNAPNGKPIIQMITLN